MSYMKNVDSDVSSMFLPCLRLGDLAMAKALHARYHALAGALVSLDSNPVPLKAAMAILGRDSGVVRPPLAPLDIASAVVMRSMLENVGLASSTSEEAGAGLQ